MVRQTSSGRKLALVNLIRAREDGSKLLLDLGCGDNKAQDHLGVDIVKTAAADYVFDLFAAPWPVDDGVADGIHCSHFFEHVPGRLRPAFMDECWRILKPGAQMAVIVPYYASMRAVQDYCHEWPPVCETSFLYFNKGWREANRLTHGAYDLKCDFDFGYGYGLDPEIQARHQDHQIYAIKHQINAVMDLHVTLTRRAAPAP